MAEEGQDTTQEAKPAETNPAMEKAMADGWKPEDQYSGDPKTWVDYREFNVRGELMGRIQEQSGIIHSQKAQVDEVKAALSDLKAMQDKIADNEYNKIMKQLRHAKASAIDDGNGEAVAQIEEEIDTLKESREKARAEEAAPKSRSSNGQAQVTPEVQSWLASPNNQWYNSDAVMRHTANGIAADLATSNPTWTPMQVLSEMDKVIRKEMPNKFQSGSPVDGGDGNTRPNSGSGRKRTIKDLTQEEQDACKRFIKLDVFKNEAEYIAQLDAVGD